MIKTYHDNSRGTETTLATVGNCHALLDRMGVVHVSDSFNSDDMFAVNANQRGNASVDGSMVNLLCRWVDMRYDLINSRVRVSPRSHPSKWRGYIPQYRHHNLPRHNPASFQSTPHLVDIPTRSLLG